MNHSHTNETSDAVSTLDLGALTVPFALTAAAVPLRGDFIFPDKDGADMLRITPTGIVFRGEAVVDAGAVYNALAATMNIEAPGVIFFRNRSIDGIWVEADEHVIDIIQNSEVRENYELCVMRKCTGSTVPARGLPA